MPHLEADGEPAPAPGETPRDSPEQPAQPDAPPVATGDEAPALVIADAGAAEAAGVLRFTVTLSRAAREAVTVAYATEDGTASAGTDYRAAVGTLSFAAESTAAQQIEVRLIDDPIDEATETFTVRLSDARAATLADATATGSIVDDDARALTVEPTELNVVEGANATYRVVLGSRPTAAVTVTVSSGSAELTVAPDRLRFTPADWGRAQTITVSAEQDEDALADEAVELTHAATGGGYERNAAAVRVTLVEDDVATVAVAAGRAAEGDGRLRFEVSLSLASEAPVSVEYATGAAGDSAAARLDYAPSSGTVRFPARSTAVQMIEVPVHDDRLDEPEEEFSVTLSNAAHAVLAGGGATMTATGTIEDDDPPPQVSIADASVTEGAGMMRFAVTLAPSSGRTVTADYATSDVTATAAADYTQVSGTLTFGAGSSGQTIAVPILSDTEHEDTETFTVMLSGPSGATLAAAAATGTIEDDDAALQPIPPSEHSEPPEPPEPSDSSPPQLATLQVTGGGTMHPAFAGDILHYALRCADATTLSVTARAANAATPLTLLRANREDSQEGTGTLNAQITVNGGHDVAIELSGAGGTVTYVVHCIPTDYPDIGVLARTATATDGLLFITNSVTAYRAIVDYNGVTRYHVKASGRSFRPHADGPLIDGRRVRYSVLLRDGGMRLMDAAFNPIRTVRPLGSLPFDHHDAVVGADSYLFISYVQATRDYREWQQDLGNSVPVSDSVITELAFAGTDAGSERRRWNSWDHLKIVPDCEVLRSEGEYAHLNSLQLVDGDIIASFRGCAQVVRIERSTGTWGLKWKLGGTAPPRSSNTEFLEVVGDPLGEFCGQHHATLTGDKLVLFDNGNHCIGSRKDDVVVSRVVQYDISSGTQATFEREYRRPAGHGYSFALGGVTVLENGHWLIAWGTAQDRTSPADETAAVTEVDSAGNAVFHMSMSLSGALHYTYRVYHDYEDNVSIPLSLP